MDLFPQQLNRDIKTVHTLRRLQIFIRKYTWFHIIFSGFRMFNNKSAFCLEYRDVHEPMNHEN